MFKTRLAHNRTSQLVLASFVHMELQTVCITHFYTPSQVTQNLCVFCPALSRFRIKVPFFRQNCTGLRRSATETPEVIWFVHTMILQLRSTPFLCTVRTLCVTVTVCVTVWYVAENCFVTRIKSKERSHHSCSLFNVMNIVNPLTDTLSQLNGRLKA